jgi:hypothetical protein
VSIFGNPELRTERVLLERLRVAAQSRIPDERLYRLMHDARAESWVDHEMLHLVVTLEKMVYAQRLAPEYIDLDFTRPVQVEHGTRFYRQVPESRVDLLLLALPRRLRWRLPRYRTVDAQFQRPVTWTDVRIQDQVIVERFWTYPDSTWAMPPDTWGSPVVFERLVPPS